MPWCEPCAKYFAPSAMNEDGTCPQCGDAVQVNDMAGRVTAGNLDLRALAGKESDAKAPWHFKLLVGLLCVYLGWRFVQLFT